jgi:hypothetical protein
MITVIDGIGLTKAFQLLQKEPENSTENELLKGCLRRI